MTFVYFGSFHVSADILDGMVAGGLTPVLVVCSPDRPAGRKQTITAPATKQLIQHHGWQIPIVQPEKPTDIIDQLKQLNADLFIVMGYPHIIPQEIISLPRLGTVGVHPSLLPKYRGASPMQSVLLNDEKETGVTLYCIDEKVDHGPILARSTWQVAESETNASLEKHLAQLAAKLIIETVPAFVAGKIIPQEQDHAQATLTKKFTTADAQVDMQHDAPRDIFNKIRAFTPEPGVWTMNFPGREGKRVKLLAGTYQDKTLTITEIHPDGKKPMTVNQAIGESVNR